MLSEGGMVGTAARGGDMDWADGLDPSGESKLLKYSEGKQNDRFLNLTHSFK